MIFTYVYVLSDDLPFFVALFIKIWIQFVLMWLDGILFEYGFVESISIHGCGVPLVKAVSSCWHKAKEPTSSWWNSKKH